MCKVISKLTVFFDEPFWVGIYERECCGMYEASKIVFGAEPKDYDVYGFILKNYVKLRFSPPAKSSFKSEKKINPKRMRRIIKKQMEKSEGAGTKAQQALKLSYEQGKIKRKEISREQKEIEAERKYELRTEKRKEKHNGH